MSGLKILLGVTGGIAACKAPQIVRALRSKGAEVRCAVTRNASSFVAPLSLEILSGHPVFQEEYLDPSTLGQAGGGEELHVTAAEWADVFLIAPATANTLGHLALGLAPDFITTTALMRVSPLALAPAMHSNMWNHAAVRTNLSLLRSRHALVLGPDEGPLASGESGVGRMMEPAEIAEQVVSWAATSPDSGARCSAVMEGLNVLVAAGPTHEPIDPVRYIGNRSSGKMGFALANAAQMLGAEVTVVAGPTAQPHPPSCRVISVETAIEMETAIHERAADADLIVMAAAVADFRPLSAADRKIKKTPGSNEVPEIQLVRNPDILAGLSKAAPQAFRVGFAAETHDMLEHAESKLKRKQAHALVANDVSRSDIGFSSDHNEVVLLLPDHQPERLDRAPKAELARALMERFAELMVQRNGAGHA